MKRNLLKLALCAMALLPLGAWADFDPTESYTWDFTQAVSSTDFTNVKADIANGSSQWSQVGDVADKRYAFIPASNVTSHQLTANNNALELTNGLLFNIKTSNAFRFNTGNYIELYRENLAIVIPGAKAGYTVKVTVNAIAASYLTASNLTAADGVFGSVHNEVYTYVGTVTEDGDVVLTHTKAGDSSVGTMQVRKIEYLTPTDACTYNENRNNSISAGSDVTITIARTLKKDVWNSICLPMAFTKDQFEEFAGTGAQLAEYTEVTGSLESVALKFEVKDLSTYSPVAGRPYLIKPTKDCEIITLTGNVVNDDKSQTRECNSGSFGKFGFTRVYSPTVVGSEDFYFADGNKLKNGNGTSKIKAFRGYIKYTAVSPSLAKNYTPEINFFIEDKEGNTTAINHIEGLKVITDGAVYNMSGQRVSNSTKGLKKGLYIVNGKKYFVK